MGFLTNDTDRNLLLEKQDVAAAAITMGIVGFLTR